MKEKEEVFSPTEEKREITYSKEQILSSQKYRDRKDLLSALLEKEKGYTLKQVEEIMKNKGEGELNGIRRRKLYHTK